MSSAVLPAPDRPTTTFAERLRAARQERGLKWYELAILASVSPSLISKWEAGHAIRPNADALARVARALRIDAGDLTGE